MKNWNNPPQDIIELYEQSSAEKRRNARKLYKIMDTAGFRQDVVYKTIDNLLNSLSTMPSISEKIEFLVSEGVDVGKIPPSWLDHRYSKDGMMRSIMRNPKYYGVEVPNGRSAPEDFDISRVPEYLKKYLRPTKA